MAEYTGDLEKTKEIAHELAAKAKPGDCYCLHGELGAGKTEFCRAFIKAIYGDVKVTSPTYNIVISYDSVNHFDLYRIKDANELEEIGFSEMLASGINLIEWPEVAGDLIPQDRTDIRLEIIDADNRKISVTSNKNSTHPALDAGSSGKGQVIKDPASSAGCVGRLGQAQSDAL